MSLVRSALAAAAAVELLAGCYGNTLSMPSSPAQVDAQANHLVNGRFIPGWSKFANLIPV